MPNEIITPAGSPPPMASYSPGVNGKVVGAGDIKVQTRCVIESIKKVIEKAGGNLSHVAYNVIFLSDLAHYKEMNEVYAEYFSAHPPARYCIRADLVKPEFLVEISSIAHL
jgi:aminoacrylate peracid reductase